MPYCVPYVQSFATQKSPFTAHLVRICAVLPHLDVAQNGICVLGKRVGRSCSIALSDIACRESLDTRIVPCMPGSLSITLPLTFRATRCVSVGQTDIHLYSLAHIRPLHIVLGSPMAETADVPAQGKRIACLLAPYFWRMQLDRKGRLHMASR